MKPETKEVLRMNSTYLILLIVLFIILYEQNKDRIAARHIQKKRSPKERKEMQELAKQFIGKECLIYTIKSDTVQGVLKGVTEGGLLIENKGETEAVNLDYVVRLREYPKNKKGKKKSVVLD